MFDETHFPNVVGSTAYGTDGGKIGRVGQLFVDDTTGQAEFVTVNTGFFGSKESFVPVAQAEFDGSALHLPYDKDLVKGAPNVDLEGGGHLPEGEEERLYAHYGLAFGQTGFADPTQTGPTGTGTSGTGTSGTGTSGTGTTGTTGTGTTGTGPVGRDTSGPTTDEAMTRSEEHLDVGKTSQESGRARLRKYVTTETETRTVPVAKERAVVESEPVTGENRDQALDGPEISEEEHEVVLNEERPVVGKSSEPVERVRMGKETDIEEETVSEEVRKEHIEVEGDAEDRRRRP